MPRAQVQRVPRATGAEITAVGWQAEADLQYEDWLRYGSRLGLAGRNAAWWVGDWVRYGTGRYGSKYAAAARVTGYDRQTLMNYVYVATRFEFSRRRENLSWSHHAELAALELEAQEKWLDRSERERLTVRDLREAVSSKGDDGRSEASSSASRRLNQRHSRDVTPAPEGVHADRIITCPHCGEPFVA